MISIHEAKKLTGRVLMKDGVGATVSMCTTEEEVHVWYGNDPQTQELIVFSSLELFNNWAYGTPVPSAG